MHPNPLLRWLALSAVLWSIGSCIEPYFPELDTYDRFLVVDGRITSAPGPYTLRLHQASGIYTPEYLPVTGGRVEIGDDQGLRVQLYEVQPGVYQTDSAALRGIPGRSYVLSIRLPDGRTYESAAERMPEPVAIDTVYAEVVYREAAGFDYALGGYQFYVDTERPADTAQYFLWEAQATYKYQSDYLIYWAYRGYYEPVADPYIYYTCWRSEVVPQLFTYATRGLDDPQIRQFPLHFVDTESKRLRLRYSLLLNQLTLGEDAYAFWQAVESQHEAQGALYTQQPYQIRGNVTNTDDPAEPVLGYFTVAGLSSQRVFVDPPEGGPFHVARCQLTTEMLGYILSVASSWPIYVGLDELGRRGIGEGGCLDCREAGGTITRPDFWIE
ncbi:MAG: hypothetical protein OHK0039_30940 [Bacteroidia bacterium]